MGLGWPEVLVVLLIALVLFGKHIPALMGKVGRSVAGIKKGVKEVQEVNQGTVK